MNLSEHSSKASSSQQSPQQVPQRLKWLLYGVIVIASIGFLDATYLAVSHFQGVAPTCSLVEGCDVVTSSSYSEVFGIPVALFGSIGYVLMLLCALFYFDVRRKSVLLYISFLSAIAFAASAWFVYLQLFVLHAICQYCMLSAVTSTLLYAIGMKLYLIAKKM